MEKGGGLGGWWRDWRRGWAACCSDIYLPYISLDAQMLVDSQVVQVLYFQEKDVAEALGCLRSRLLTKQPQPN